MRNLLYRRYERVLRANGGEVGGITQLTSLGTGAIDAFAKPNQYGFQSKGAVIGKSVLSDAGTGAAIGSVIPGVGTVAGAAIGAGYGLVSGFIKGGQQSAQQNNMRNNMLMQQKMAETSQSNAVLSADPSLITGTGQTYFKNGGTIHIKPENKGKFTAYKERTGKTTKEALHSPDAHVRKMAQFAENASHWKKEDGGTMSILGAPVHYGKEVGSTPRTPLNDLITSGGDAKKLSSDNALIRGNSHAEGGIQIPELDTEVEGGETTKDNYVFSKKLGFADMHLPIAKAKGIIEKKPRTLERANSMRLLADKEQRLMQEQEQVKQARSLK